MNDEDIIKGCLKQDRSAQQHLFQQTYGKMMGICIRYAKSHTDARDICREGFKEVFSGIRNFVEENNRRKKDHAPVLLEDWVKKTIVKAAIDHMHKNKREYFVSSTVNVRDAERKPGEAELTDEQVMGKAGQAEILKALQQLTPSQRAIYNLHEVDGFSHADISLLLDIGEATSRDNLNKAKYNFKKNLARLVK